MSGGKPWAGIVRVSHMGDRQAGSESFHADREQVEAVRRYAAAHGADVEFLPPELSVSGGRPIEERPSLRAAIEGVEAGKYSAIVVAYLSRLTRSRSGLEIWNRVEAAGGHVHCAAENLDTSTPSGRFVRDVHLANAVREREEHVVRFDERARAATAAGIWQRRQTPRGYVRDPDTRRLVPGPDADGVRAAFRERAAGVPIVEISRRLRMTPNGVRHLLRNRVYLGELRVREYVNAAAHEPLVTPEEYAAAQRAVSTRPERGPRADGPALLAGLVRCAGCGHVMTRTASSGRTGKRIEAYSCTVNHSAGRCPAPATITLRRLEEHVQRIALAELAKLSTRSTARGDRGERARAAVRDAEAELAAFLEATSAAGLGADVFAAGLRQRQAAVDEARANLERELEREPVSVIGDPVAAWDVFDVRQRNRLLRRLVECVIVERSGGRGRVRPVEDRTRIIAFGAGIAPERVRGGRAAPIVALPLPELDDERVLRVDLAE